jgi:hypothetical protein
MSKKINSKIEDLPKNVFIIILVTFKINLNTFKMLKNVIMLN